MARAWRDPQSRLMRTFLALLAAAFALPAAADGLSHPNSVSTYQHRYPDMPRPAVDLGEGRCKLWLRSEIEGWVRRRESIRR